MRLTEFIHQNHDKIIAEWMKFAATLLPWAKGLSDKDLRDHAAELLTAVVIDIEAPQSNDQQSDKSQGLAAGGSALARVGHKHADQRLQTGFNLDQLVSEYRALRASVFRLWEEASGETMNEVTRFNEAIDESLTEATVRYSQSVDHTREQFLAILGHDLRNPLSAISMGAQMLTQSESRLDDKNLRIATRILNSAARMDRMVNDLLDLTRTRLGEGIPVVPKRMDLAPACVHVLAELEAIHPDSPVRFEAKGDLHGEWDHDRLVQVISNLVANALQHGGDNCDVHVTAEEHGEEVVLRVQNDGPRIPEDALKTIFEPMVRKPTQKPYANANGLGIGLFIVREIVTAHGGTVGVTSTAQEGTTFTVQLPRHVAA